MRSKAFVINGGAGRVLCSIPAFEQYYKESGDEDFIIVCEGGTELYKGHPLLDSRCYDHWHKNLFKDKLKDMDIVTPEPYRIWEYYNQKASLAQGFDIAINNKGIRDLPVPTLKLSREELLNGIKIIEESKEKLKKDKIVVFQPFGRGIAENCGVPVDPTGRSFEFQNVISVIKKFQDQGWGVILFSEVQLDTKKAKLKDDLIKLEGANLRLWAAVIAEADLFVGCDSVGQHLSYVLETPTVVVIGSTYPINVSYPENNKFKVMDLGEIDRQYSPIRITMDEAVDRNNERLMSMTDAIENYLLEACKSVIKKSNNSKQLVLDKPKNDKNKITMKKNVLAESISNAGASV